jgi:hypothetical protein
MLRETIQMDLFEAELTRADRGLLRAVDANIAASGEPWKKTIRLVTAWESTTADIEKISRRGIDEYLYDLMSRDTLAFAIEQFPADRLQSLRRRVELADQSLLNQTAEDIGGLLGTFYRLRPDDGWWWRRIPLSKTACLNLQLSA